MTAAFFIQLSPLLTGDSQSVADTIVRQLGLDQYRAELLPEDKVDALEDFFLSVTVVEIF